MLNKSSQYFGIGIVLVAVGAVAACSSSDSGTTTTSAGGSTARGGTGGTGTTSGGTGTGTGGTATGGTGTVAGGTGGTATGAGGSGGAGGPAACVAPTSSTVTSFADLVANPTSAGNFTYTAGISGGTYWYNAPSAALVLADSGMALHVTGTIKDYDGFGLYLKCTDATAYTGVSFNIKGNAGPTAMMSFRIHTYSDTPSTDMPPGGCPVPAGTAAGATYPICHAAAKEIPVSAGGGVVNVLFADLAGGLPVATVSAKEINGLEWAFDYTAPAAGAGGAGGAAGAATGYAADITVDDIKFTGGTGPQGGGGTSAGGTGGSTGGTGGAGTAGGGTGGA